MARFVKMGCKHAAVIFVTVLAALLHSVDAAWSVQASIRNLCSETIKVTFSGYDAGDVTYTGTNITTTRKIFGAAAI